MSHSSLNDTFSTIVVQMLLNDAKKSSNDDC